VEKNNFNSNLLPFLCQISILLLKVPTDHDSRSNYVKLFVGSVPRTATKEDVSITSMLLSCLLA
jgi:hypothetical protein